MRVPSHCKITALHICGMKSYVLQTRCFVGGTCLQDLHAKEAASRVAKAFLAGSE